MTELEQQSPLNESEIAFLGECASEAGGQILAGTTIYLTPADLPVAKLLMRRGLLTYGDETAKVTPAGEAWFSNDHKKACKNGSD